MLAEVSTFIEQLIMDLGVFAPLLACVCIIVESMLPVLPLCTFITVNFIAFGNALGFVISWIFTLIGCFLAYYLVKKGYRSWQNTRMRNASILDAYIAKFNKITIPSLTLLVAVPFTPAFIVNIAAGLANVPVKKFLPSVIIGKIFMVYFWGFIGKGIVESFQSPMILIRVAIMLVIAYGLSLIVKKFIKE